MEQHTLVGNLTRNPELRFTNDGKPVTSFGIAVNRRYNVDGEWHEQVTFFNCVAFGAHAENVARTVSKADRVIAVGRFENRNWTTDTGEARHALEFVAVEVASSLRFIHTADSDNNSETVPA